MSKESAVESEKLVRFPFSGLKIRKPVYIPGIGALTDPKEFTGLQVSDPNKGSEIWIPSCGCDKCR